MKLLLSMVFVISSAAHAQVPPEYMQQYLEQKSHEDPMVLELEYKGVSPEGVFQAMVLKDQGQYTHDEIVNKIVKEDADNIRSRRNSERLPHAQNVAYLVCGTRIVALNDATIKRKKKETVDIYKTIVKPEGDDTSFLRICLMAQADVYQLLGDNNPEKEAMRTVLRDTYIELEKTEDAIQKNQPYTTLKPYRAVKSATVSR